jgi:hypothetical protein
MEQKETLVIISGRDEEGKDIINSEINIADVEAITKKYDALSGGWLYTIYTTDGNTTDARSVFNPSVETMFNEAANPNYKFILKKLTLSKLNTVYIAIFHNNIQSIAVDDLFLGRNKNYIFTLASGKEFVISNALIAEPGVISQLLDDPLSL